MFGHLTRAPLPAGPAHRQDQSAYPAFCELAVRLYTPNLNNLGAKSPIVSGLRLKYSRFLETRARDRARSALRGGPGSVSRDLCRGCRQIVGRFRSEIADSLRWIFEIFGRQRPETLFGLHCVM